MQTTLKLPAANRAAYRPVLVSVDVVMQQLRLTEDSVFEMADSGELRWVWNVALKSEGRRELRFWLGELLNRANSALQTERVLEMVIGHATERNLTRRTAGQILGLRRCLVMRLVDAKELTAPSPLDSGHITRASLVSFLSRRLLN